MLQRRKKYPAVAVGEFFNPIGSNIEPMFDSDSPKFDPRAYVWELICSEIFLTTSPSNLHAMAKAHSDLCQQFGIPPKEGEDLVASVKHDLGILAKSTSLSDSITPPRLLHLIPAMTKRAVDYSISGQASFLASGITTVFCNASHYKFSKGQSCIIGHDCWGRDTDSSTGFPSLGPYHGLKPGIYNPSASNSGRLGEHEQALVIADIDPVYSMEGKPRPQMLPPPLALVAHLPIIESWIDSKKRPKRPMCVCETMSDRTEIVKATVARLLEYIKRAGPIYSTFEDARPAVLAEAMKSLADLASADQDSWMHKRIEAYLHEHAATPASWPPPCAMDWLWVDLGDPATVKLPSIEMPAYSHMPSENNKPDSNGV